MKELRRLFGYMRPYMGRIVAATVLLGIAGALMSAVFLTLQPLVDEVFVGNKGAASVAAAPVAAPQGHPARFDFLASVKHKIPMERFIAWAKDRAYVEVPLL